MSLREALERQGTWKYHLERNGGSVIHFYRDALMEFLQPGSSPAEINKGGEPTTAKGGEPSEPAYLCRIRDLALPGSPPRTCLPSPPRTCPPTARTWRSPECRHSLSTTEYIKLHLPSRLSAAGDGLLQLGLAQPTSIMPLVEVGDPTKMHQQRRMKDLSPG